MRRQLKAGASATVLLAAATTVALTVGSTQSHAEGVPSSAYGLAAEGPIPIEPTPFVESTDGSRQTSSLVEVPDNPVVGLSAATVTAEGATASVQLADLAVGGGLLAEIPEPPPELVTACEQLEAGATENIDPELLAPVIEPLEEALGGADIPLDDLTALCETLLTPPDSLLGAQLVEVFCDGSSGGINVADLTILGQPADIPADPPPNTEIPADPLLHVTVNRQTSNADGSFTVEALVVSLLDGTEVLTVGSATCGNPRASAPPPAPAPVPVETRAPVTG
jgi:hypothetical protein